MKDNKLLDLKGIFKQFENSTPYQRIGKICSSKGLIYEVNLSRAVIGSSVEFVTELGDRCLGEVVGINNSKCLVMPYTEITGVNSETLIYLKTLTTTIKVSTSMVGRVVDFQGNPIDEKGPLNGPFEVRS